MNPTLRGFRTNRTIAAAVARNVGLHSSSTPHRPVAAPTAKSRDNADAAEPSVASRISSSFQRARDLLRDGAAVAAAARRTSLPAAGSAGAEQPGNPEGTVYVWSPDQSKFSGSAADWKAAVTEAESVVHPKGGSVINPSNLLGSDLAIITKQIRRLLGSGHPVLNTVSSYYFQQQGKHVRPLIVLLMSMATSIAPKAVSIGPDGRFSAPDEDTIDQPLAGIRQISFPPRETGTSSSSSPLLDVTSEPDLSLPHILPSQRRLAEITEMIHTASLLHDDVIDESATRRSRPSANAAFGNKMAILAGDFLLARASVALARLRDVEVVELLATVISNLVEGEFMQLRNSQAADAEGRILDRFDYYLEKTYLKTASLIAKSCRAAAVLGGCTRDVVDHAYEYGRSVGLAFQIVDDMLDFVSNADTLGKPGKADLNLGLATAPVLYAAEEYPELNALIERKFSTPGDVDKAFELVHKSRGLERTRKLAEEYCSRAIDAVSEFPPSEARDAMIQLTNTILTRKK